jgi:hypothetical protein
MEFVDYIKHTFDISGIELDTKDIAEKRLDGFLVDMETHPKELV